MKKIMKIFVLVAAAAMALASCQKNEFDNSTSQEYEYTFHIGNADTKATLGDVSVEWASGDKMGLYAVTTSGDVSYNTMGYITPGQPATMKVYSYNALAAGDMIYAYYPYTQGNAQIPTEVSISLPANQDGNDDMPMVSLPMVVTSDIAEKENVAVEAGEIKLVNLAAIAEFNVYSSNVEYQSEKVKSVSFTANKAIAGNFTFDLTSVDYSNAATLAISGYTDTEVVSTLSTAAAVGTAKESATKVKMVVAPGEGYTGTVVVATDKASYTFNVTKAKTFTRSSVLPLAVDLANGERVENAAEPEGTVSVTISFASDAQRVSQDGNGQVWENDGITFTNAKYNSTNAVVNNVNPVRLYKNSKITIEAPANITEIEYNSASGDYFSNLKSLLPNASVNGTVVTEVYDGSSNVVEYELSTGQLRLNSITVTYSTEGYVPPVLESIAVSGDYKTEFTQGSEFSFGGVVTATYDNGSSKIVTNDCEFTGYDLEELGSQEVTVSYEGKTAEYNIEVIEKSQGDDTKYYVKVTSAPSDWSGTYLIVFADNKARSYVDNKDLASKSGSVLTISDDKIAVSETTEQDAVVISAKGSGYKIKLSDGKFLTVPASNACGQNTEANAGELTISYSTSGVSISGKDSSGTVRYLCANGSYYRMYKSVGTYKLPTLYRLED